MAGMGSAPIAQVAGEAATRAALDELSAALSSARTEGRLIEALPLGVIDQPVEIMAFESDQWLALSANHSESPPARFHLRDCQQRGRFKPGLPRHRFDLFSHLG